jgi:hypothetical protein
MPFSSKCVTSAFHDEWNCIKDDKLTTKIRTPLRTILLELAGKKKCVNYPKTEPKFCQSCINKATELEQEQTGSSLLTDPVDELSTSHQSLEDIEENRENTENRENMEELLPAKVRWLQSSQF